MTKNSTSKWRKRFLPACTFVFSSVYSARLPFLFYGTILGETIFHSKEAGEYVHSFSLLCPFMYAAQTTSSILNGFGKTKQTLYHNLLGVGIRIFFILLLIPSKGIFGYLLGLLAGYSLQLLLNIYYIYRTIPFSFCVQKTILYPVITAIICGILSKKCLEIATVSLQIPAFYILAASGCLYFFLFILSAAFKGVCHYTTRAICSHKIRLHHLMRKK